MFTYAISEYFGEIVADRWWKFAKFVANINLNKKPDYDNRRNKK